MNMNRNDEERIYCPVEKDVVTVRGNCDHCPFWDGLKCTAGDGAHLAKRAGRIARGFRKLLKGMKRPGRRGRGLRVPTVWESWPMYNAPGEVPPALDEESAPGVPGPDFYGIEHYEPEEDDYVLPELIEELWDVEPDAPDWVSGQESALPPPGDPLVPDSPACADDHKLEPFPPGIEQGPGIENPDDCMPGFPPDIPGEGMP